MRLGPSRFACVRPQFCTACQPQGRCSNAWPMFGVSHNFAGSLKTVRVFVFWRAITLTFGRCWHDWSLYYWRR